MGGKCCAERKTEAAGAAKTSTKSSTGNVRLHLMPTLTKAKAKLMVNIKGRDAEQFEEAFVGNDIPAFVKLLSSERSLGEGQLEDVPEHPWAHMPNSVGALAATQLAVTASMDEANVVTIRQSGAIELLANYLKPKVSPDRRDAGVVLLVFLTSVDKECCLELGQKNVLADILRILADDKEQHGLRCAISTVLTNVLLEHHGTAAKFIRENGAVQLLKACDPKGCKPEDLHFFSELIENVLELIRDPAEENQEDTGGSKFIDHIRKAIEKKPETLTILARKFPGTDLESNITQLIEAIS